MTAWWADASRLAATSRLAVSTAVAGVPAVGVGADGLAELLVQRGTAH